MMAISENPEAEVHAWAISLAGSFPKLWRISIVSVSPGLGRQTGVWRRVVSENEGLVCRGSLWYLIEHSYLMSEIMMNLVVEVSMFLHVSLNVADDEDDA
jgi:hypothetical protein